MTWSDSIVKAVALCLALSTSSCDAPAPPEIHAPPTRLADLWRPAGDRESTLVRAAVKNISRTGIPISIEGPTERVRFLVPSNGRLTAQVGLDQRRRQIVSFATLRVEVCSDGGEDEAIEPLASVEANLDRWVPLEIDLSPHAGRELELCFSAHFEPRNERALRIARNAVVVLADASVAGTDPRPPIPATPNLLVITLDTLRGDHLSSAGYERETTPHLDALAREGEQYLDAITNSSWTLPSHASLFTGLHPREHGARSDPAGEHSLVWSFVGLSESALTLAERLWQRGARTGAVVAGPAVSAEFGISQGFDFYDQPKSRAQDPSITSELFDSRSAAELTDLALAWVDEDARPFFLFLNYFDAHWPYEPPPDLASRFMLPEATPIPNDQYGAIWVEVMQGRRDLREAERRTMIDLYDSEILGMDRELGRLFESLRARGLYDSTMIVVVSDHGEAFGEHRLVDHGVGLYEHQLHAALIVKYPADRAADRVGERLRHRVDLLDVHATILRELDLFSELEDSPERLRLDAYGLDKQRALHFSELERNSWSSAVYGDRFDRNLEAVYRDHWKLIRSDRGELELFHLERDPGELENLAEVEPSIARELGAALDAWTQSAAPSPEGSDAVPLTPELTEQLRALGYLPEKADDPVAPDPVTP